jgi:hypothetical protein
MIVHIDDVIRKAKGGGTDDEDRAMDCLEKLEPYTALDKIIEYDASGLLCKEKYPHEEIACRAVAYGAEEILYMCMEGPCPVGVWTGDVHWRSFLVAVAQDEDSEWFPKELLENIRSTWIPHDIIEDLVETGQIAEIDSLWGRFWGDRQKPLLGIGPVLRSHSLEVLKWAEEYVDPNEMSLLRIAKDGTLEMVQWYIEKYLDGDIPMAVANDTLETLVETPCEDHLFAAAESTDHRVYPYLMERYGLPKPTSYLPQLLRSFARAGNLEMVRDLWNPHDPTVVGILLQNGHWQFVREMGSEASQKEGFGHLMEVLVAKVIRKTPERARRVLEGLVGLGWRDRVDTLPMAKAAMRVGYVGWFGEELKAGGFLVEE